MRVKCLKKFLSCLCAVCMSASICSSAFAIKTTSRNKALQNAVDICNDHIFNVEAQIDVHLKELAKQKKDKQVANIIDSLSKMKQIFKKLNVTKLNNLNKFNILAFNKNLLDLRTYMAGCKNQKNINLDEMAKKIEAFGVNRWSECVNSLSAEDEIDNDLYENGALEDDINFFLNNFQKSPDTLKNDGKFRKSLREYVKKYVSNYENLNLDFITKNFQNAIEWKLVFEKYLGSEKFVEDVISAFERDILNNAIKSLGISTVLDLNCFLGKTIAKKIEEWSDKIGQSKVAESQCLSYILKLRTIIYGMYGKVESSNEYNESDLNFLAVELRDIEKIFDKFFKDLAGNSWISTLSMSDEEIDKACEKNVLYINGKKFVVGCQDLEMIFFVREICSPINEIMNLMVNDQLGETCLEFTSKIKTQFKSEINNLLSNIENMCRHLKISKNGFGASRVIYDDGDRKFENGPPLTINVVLSGSGAPFIVNTSSPNFGSCFIENTFLSASGPFVNGSIIYPF